MKVKNITPELSKQQERAKKIFREMLQEEEKNNEEVKPQLKQ